MAVASSLSSLTCKQYEVYVAKMGGKPLVCRLTGTTSIQYKRVLNDFSEATIQTRLDAECRNALSSVNPWEHEILIFRDSVLVWVGPILSITYSASESSIQVYARDLMAWTEKRVIELVNEDYEVYETDIKDIFDWVLSHGYNKAPWNMTWNLTATGIPMDKFYPGYFPPDRWGGAYPVVGDELRSLAQVGIDYTVVNRVLYAGDLQIKPPSGNILKIADQNWAKTPDVVVNGSPMSTRTIVAGGAGGYFGWYDDQIWIEKSTQPWGLLETITERSDLDDSYTLELPNAITQEAYGRHKLLSRPLAYISGGELSGDAPFDFSDLIPGVKMSVGLLKTLRDIETDYRLIEVGVQVSDTAEKIGLVLTLPGVEDIRI